MNILVVYPPLSYPFSPYLSVPILVGQLKSAGYNAKGIDLNAEFNFDILKKEFLNSEFENIIKKFNSLTDIKTDIDKKIFKTLSQEEQILISQKEYLEDIIKNKKIFTSAIENIEKAIDILKSKDKCYNPKKFYYAQQIFKLAKKVALSSYYPNVTNQKYEVFSASYKDIKYQCCEKSVNPFIEYYTRKIEEGLFDNYDMIAISVPDICELIPTLTLAKLLKEKTNAKIVIGGNLITRTEDAFVNNPEVFDIFIDGMLWGDGENSIIEYAKFVEGKIKIEEVENLYYKSSNGNVVHNDIKPYVDIENRALPSLDGFDLSKYLLPELEFSIQCSKGCYYNKCTFCDYSYGRPHYCCYSIDKLYNEILYLHQTFGIKHFEFVDEALKIDFFSKFCDKLIESGLKINMYCYFRLESNFTQEILDKFFKAGVVAIQWGYETESKRILNLMNKGIIPEKRLEILKMSNKAGIWNRVFFITMFPSETEEEILQTLTTIDTHDDVINSFELYVFALEKHSNIKNIQSELEITQIIPNNDFIPTNSYILSSRPKGTTAVQLYDKLMKKRNKQFWYLCQPDEFLLIFLSKYSLSQFTRLKF